MIFTVVWKPSAKRSLAEIWLRSADERARITTASNLIDLALRRSPQVQGESRAGNLRVLFVAPLVAVYEVHPLDMRVDVLGIREYTRKGRE